MKFQYVENSKMPGFYNLANEPLLINFGECSGFYLRKCNKIVFKLYIKIYFCL